MATAPLVPLDHVERRSWLRRFIGMVCRRYRTRSTPISIQDKARFPRSPFVGNWVSEKNSSSKLAEQAVSRALVSPQLICELPASLHERGIAPWRSQ